jgi:hypothetical protein
MNLTFDDPTLLKLLSKKIVLFFFGLKESIVYFLIESAFSISPRLAALIAFSD